MCAVFYSAAVVKYGGVVEKLEYSPSEPPDYFGYDSSGLSHDAIAAAALAASNKRSQAAPAPASAPTDATTAGNAPASSAPPPPGPVAPAAPDASLPATAPVAASVAGADAEVLSGQGADASASGAAKHFERAPEQPSLTVPLDASAIQTSGAVAPY